MGLFYNALDGPPSKRQKLGFLLYVITGLISVWATAESIITSFDFPVFISYLLGAVIVLLISAILSILKKSFEEKKILKIAFMIFLFIGLWFLSLATNSHKFFTQLKLEDIRKNELDVATNELKNIRDNSTAIGNQIINDYREMVTSRILSYEAEVSNPKNCGHGPVADSLKRMVEESMAGTKFNLLSGYNSGSADCRKLASLMGEQMNQQLNFRLDAKKKLLLNVDDCEDDDLRTEIEEGLEKYNTFYNNKSSIEVKDVLSKSHQYYNKLFLCLKNKLELKDNADNFVEKLKMPVPSIELEKISALLPFVSEHKEHKGSFILSVAIAFLIDLSAFAIFYFMVLSKEEDY